MESLTTVMRIYFHPNPKDNTYQIKAVVTALSDAALKSRTNAPNFCIVYSNSMVDVIRKANGYIGSQCTLTAKEVYRKGCVLDADIDKELIQKILYTASALLNDVKAHVKAERTDVIESAKLSAIDYKDFNDYGSILLYVSTKAFGKEWLPSIYHGFWIDTV